ncbi:TetR family transcriptional regulator [Mycobacterium kiyosense]|uniref:TetR family transcriptional regulator n=1 Tax=Mycobacterium kiyosense TaxID=2871094 RepID=A0A9P3Q8Y1_9MYCO|nr:TetR family transcriptional regulator [Mycobacterium sp. 20KCMC460]GLB83933.1 TetR family transcriptional regulator [Mycobacterium kiyosense]GLB90491.1 TetR family transcriptional regulator [Mycobacterium kiyosense]GLB96293.1 TetR family transcriptional regulator [Mycobacterium kiyosense]GLC02967.1 TetR family transcriptional regulator [Mycobacterium kiyosense]
MVDHPPVPPELIEAAVRAAEVLNRDIAEVPVSAIAAEAGISRSTLLRRLGGSRSPLDAAVRAAGIDPGGRPPVRLRALTAAAALISENGLAAATLEAIAERADCSVFSLHAAFGGRDELMRAVFDQFSPIRDIEEFLARAQGDFDATVHGFYRTVANALNREPRVTPAVFAEAFSRPTSTAVQSLARYAVPRMFGTLGVWFEAEIRAGRIRDQPVIVLTQNLLGPILIHMLMRPAFPDVPGLALPDVDDVCDAFAANFIRAVATPEHRKPT